MPILKLAVIILISFGAASCSSGNKAAPFIEERDYGALLSEGNQLLDKFEDHEFEIPVIPAKGTANYKGIVGLFDAGGLADISLTADFGNSSISGRIDNFKSSDNTKINGYADLSQGKLTGQNFAADLSGVFDGAKLTGDMDGGFYGKDASIVYGNLNAKVGSETYRGEFVAEEND